MKKTLLAISILFSLMLAGVPAFATTFSIQSKLSSASDSQHIAPSISVTTADGTSANLNGLTINYYLYIGRLPITWGTPTLTLPAGFTGATINVARIATATTSYNNGSNLTNANFAVQIKITQTKMVGGASGTFTFSFSLASNPAANFDQTDDYSWVNSTTNTNNNRITLTDSTGAVKYGSAPQTDLTRQLGLAQQKIKHVFVIMQENRSFDSFFGSFPNADGVSNAPQSFTYSCTDSGGKSHTYNSYPTLAASESFLPPDPPHLMADAKYELGCTTTTGDTTCTLATGQTNQLDPTLFLKHNTNGCNDAELRQTVGHFDSSTIKNYWQMASNFVLQDKMFAPAPSYSKVTHLYMVSGWSADCSSGVCKSNMAEPPLVNNQYNWKDLTDILDHRSPRVSWGLFKGEDWNSACDATSCNSSPFSCLNGNDKIVWFWNPLNNFKTVSDNGTLGNAQLSLWNFLDDVNEANDSFVPQVSWIVPGMAVSDHAAQSDVKVGQAYVTMLVQQIMKNPVWANSVIYLAWDDWGGLYDHVRPPRDSNGNLMYGIRVPGIAISPFIQNAGYVDHQQLSFDSYLRFIEDVFAGGTRISTSDGRPFQRETVAGLGNLLYEFDFNRTPIATDNILGLNCSAN